MITKGNDTKVQNEVIAQTITDETAKRLKLARLFPKQEIKENSDYYTYFRQNINLDEAIKKGLLGEAKDIAPGASLQELNIRKPVTDTISIDTVGGVLNVNKDVFNSDIVSFEDLLGDVATVIANRIEYNIYDTLLSSPNVPVYNTTQTEDTMEAYGQFNEKGSLTKAEILYKGDISKWKKFNASLRMMMAIKMADVDPTNGKARFAKAYADGGMTEVTDGFHYTFDASNASYSAWMYYVGNMNYSARNENFVPNKFIVDALKEHNDPRMFSYFTLDGYKGKVAGDPADVNAYKGVPFGFASNPEVVAAAEGCASVNATYCDAAATYGVITTARTLLVEAEAAVLGWIDADPKALYEAGIKASFDFQATYHTDVKKIGGDTCVDDYLASEKIALSNDKETALKQIVMQRFLAGFLTDAIETWSDWRRYNVPLMPLTDWQIQQRNLAYPYRMTYDPSEEESNEENVNAAIKEWLGGDDGLWSRVWWDVADNH